jgi:hypothetical protein
MIAGVTRRKSADFCGVKAMRDAEGYAKPGVALIRT